jgi:ABC-type uncharacterized transport system ATPase subunit
MLCMERALTGNPKLLLLDEPSLGLAPMLVKAIFERIRQINKQGVTICWSSRTLVRRSGWRAELTFWRPGPSYYQVQLNSFSRMKKCVKRT